MGKWSMSPKAYYIAIRGERHEWIEVSDILSQVLIDVNIKWFKNGLLGGKIIKNKFRISHYKQKWRDEGKP
jgi:hypothetical protein